MNALALKASLALWTRREKTRAALYATAKQDLEEARDGDIHPRQDLVDRFALRKRQLAEARDLIARREDQLQARKEGTVRRPHERVVRNVRNQSSRNGVKPALIVLHDTEGGNVPGVKDLQGLGDWFDNPAAQASSNVGVDAEGISARYVPDSAKAWAQAARNPESLSIEQIGFASQSAWPEAQLKKTAQYVAYWSKTYGIPIEKSTVRGVCQHSDLGAAGGGHHDCGPSYPFARVLDMARGYARHGW